MRHFLLPGAVGPGARGMVAATITSALVAPAGRALFGAPPFLGASSIAVDVAAVAMGADEHFSPAARAEQQARGCKTSAMGEILPPHSCSRTVWGAALIRTCQLWIGAVPVLEEEEPCAAPVSGSWREGMPVARAGRCRRARPGHKRPKRHRSQAQAIA
jgi:hypothetical protein